jgi:hypothetical protein
MNFTVEVIYSRRVLEYLACEVKWAERSHSFLGNGASTVFFQTATRSLHHYKFLDKMFCLRVAIVA